MIKASGERREKREKTGKRSGQTAAVVPVKSTGLVVSLRIFVLPK